LASSLLPKAKNGVMKGVFLMKKQMIQIKIKT